MPRLTRRPGSRLFALTAGVPAVVRAAWRGDGVRLLTRRALAVAGPAWLALCLASLVLWYRSYFRTDLAMWLGPGPSVVIESIQGQLYLEFSYPSGYVNNGPFVHSMGPSVIPERQGLKPKNYLGLVAAAGISRPGLRFVQVVVPSWVPSLLSAALSAWCWPLRRVAKRISRYRAGLCPGCGYDLRATPDRCPECGTIPPAHENPPRDRRATSDSWVR